MTAVVVLAKDPRPGAVKTRLCPPLTREQAAAVAAAALADTLDIVDSITWTAKILALDTVREHWDRPGWIRIPQSSGTLDRRIGRALEDAHEVSGGEPVLLIGMDTPHLRVDDLRTARDWLQVHDAVIAPCADGGFWALGMQRADARLVERVPMSAGITGVAQLLRLVGAGLDVAIAKSYRDVDTIDDAWHAARAAPDSRFARALRLTSAA